MTKSKKYLPVPHGKIQHFIGGFDALWQADDHLLLVKNNIYTQSYKRYFFADIQALILRVTNHRKIYGLCFGVPFALFLLIALLRNAPEKYLWLFPAGIFLLCFLVNWFRGPSCEATIVTRVQSHTLPVNRLRKARKVYQTLTALIERHQGHLETATVTGPLPLSLHQSQSPVRRNYRERILDHAYSGIFHLLFFGLLLLVGGLIGLQFQARNVAILFGYVLLILVGLVLLIFALMRQNGTTMGSSLKANTWVALVLIFSVVMLHYFEMLVYMISLGESLSLQAPWNFLSSLAARDPAEHGFYRFNLLFSAVALVAAAAAGLLQTLAFRNRRREVHQE